MVRACSTVEVSTSSSKDGEPKVTGQDQRFNQGGRSRTRSRSNQDYSGMISRWQNASPEEQQEMIKEFRSRGGGERGRRRQR